MQTTFIKSIERIQNTSLVISLLLGAVANSYAGPTADHDLNCSKAPCSRIEALADEQFSNDFFSKSVSQLATHLALRAACPRLEKNGSFDFSTEMWYLGDSLRNWASTYAEQYRDQDEFPKRPFRAAFLNVIKEKHGHFLFAPQSAERLADAFVEFLENEHARLRHQPSVEPTSTQYLRAQKADLSGVVTHLKNFNDSNYKMLQGDSKAFENCRQLRATAKFWENPDFTPTEEIYEVGRSQRELGGDRRNLLQRTIVDPVHKVIIDPVKKIVGASPKTDDSNPQEQSEAAKAQATVSLSSSTASATVAHSPSPTQASSSQTTQTPVQQSVNPKTPSKPSTKAPAFSRSVNTNLPAVTDAQRRNKGYYRYNPEDGHTYGTARTVWRIEEAGKILAKQGIVMGIGEMSAKGGRTPGHKEHQTGNDIDMRMIMNDGMAAPSNTYGANSSPSKRKYNLQKTFLAIKAMIDVDPMEIEKVFIEDNALRKMISDYMWNTYKRKITVTGCSHFDHIHISYKDR